MSEFDSTYLHVGNESQLFVDNWIIESVFGITRRWYKPERYGEEPVLRKDRPWEVFPYFTYSNYCVLYDPKDRLLKCWYEDAGLKTAGKWKDTSRLLYAESRDGIRWIKPEFDIVKFDGCSTNIIAGYTFDDIETSTDKNPCPQCGIHSQAIIIDPNPSTQDEKFRMFFSLDTANEGRQLTCAHSGDGINWRLYPSKPSIGDMLNLSDVSNLFYDKYSHQFVMNTRKSIMFKAALPEYYVTANKKNSWHGWVCTYAPHRPDLMNKRRVFQTRSHNFINWSDPVELVCSDDVQDNIDEMYYGMGQFKVGNMNFGTLGILRHADNEMDVRLVYSRDGVKWYDADRANPFLKPRGKGYFDAHMVSIVPSPIEMGDKLLFFHGGSTGHHDYWLSADENLDCEEARDLDSVKFSMGLAMLRRDGFCSIDTGDVREGIIATRPLKAMKNSGLNTGNNCYSLYVNARCRHGGSIRVTVTDLNGKTIEGFELDNCDPFTGDNVEHKVSWRGRDQIPGVNTFRRYVFYMRKAEIFSFKLYF